MDGFDWARETNPIKPEDLADGYYFYYDNGNIKSPVSLRKYKIVKVSMDREYKDSARIYYSWWDDHSDDYDFSSMSCDTFIYRVKGGNYTLYDKNGVEVNPKNLVYTDDTFDDDERKEIWEQGESDNFDWVRMTPTVKIGGKNNYPIENVPLGTKVVTHKGDVFTIEDITGGHMDFQHVWGSDMERPWIGPKNNMQIKNWHNALWLRKFEE